MCFITFITNLIDISVSCIAAELNANLNGVRIEINSTNLLEESFDNVEVPDVILVGDLCYDSSFTRTLFTFLLRMRKEHSVDIIVGDPGRHGLTEEIRNHLQPLKKFKLTESGCEENHGFGVVEVFRFK